MGMESVGCNALEIPSLIRVTTGDNMSHSDIIGVFMSVVAGAVVDTLTPQIHYGCLWNFTPI